MTAQITRDTLIELLDVLFDEAALLDTWAQSDAQSISIPVVDLTNRARALRERAHQLRAFLDSTASSAPTSAPPPRDRVPPLPAIPGGIFSRAMHAHLRPRCGERGCTSSATHGPDGSTEPIVCWSHAGNWPEIKTEGK